MRRATLNDSKIEFYAYYTQALMLMTGIANQVPEFRRTFKDIYPQFVDEGGEKMRLSMDEYKCDITVSSSQDGIYKEINLPLKPAEPRDYLRHLASYNIRGMMYDPMPETISDALSKFYSKQKSERPKYFCVEDDGDRVLKRITEYVATTKGGNITRKQAQKIVLSAMFDAGVLPASDWKFTDQHLIECVRFSDYQKDVKALKPPRGSKKLISTSGKPEWGTQERIDPKSVAITWVVIALVMTLLFLLFFTR